MRKIALLDASAESLVRLTARRFESSKTAFEFPLLGGTIA
jgi:hypothetical protein